MSKKELKAVLVIKVVSRESKAVKGADNYFSIFRGDGNLLGFCNNLRTLGITAHARWAKLGWNIFTVDNGENVTHCQALCRNMEYVILAKVDEVTEKAGIRTSQSSFSIQQRLEHIFSCKKNELKQLAKDQPDGWKFPLFSGGVCSC